MTRTTKILLLCFITLLCSCKKDHTRDTTIQIYKFQTVKDYSNYVPVELSADGSRITSHPSSINERWPVKLDSGYYLNGSMGVNSGYLSVTIEEYNSYEILSGIDSLYKLVIDKDPYLEYYERNDDGKIMNETGAYGIDTAFINSLIRSNKLESYFKRLK